MEFLEDWWDNILIEVSLLQSRNYNHFIVIILSADNAILFRSV